MSRKSLQVAACPTNIIDSAERYQAVNYISTATTYVGHQITRSRSEHYPVIIGGYLREFLSILINCIEQ